MMRAIVYVVASLAAVGIVIALANSPGEGDVSNSQPAASGSAATAVAADSQQVMDQPGTLTLHVPKMHCPSGCYPVVKKTLKNDAAVSEVELTEQKEDGAIDDPKVIVRYDKGFRLDAAIDALAQRGFAESAVVE